MSEFFGIAMIVVGGFSIAAAVFLFRSSLDVMDGMLLLLLALLIVIGVGCWGLAAVSLTTPIDLQAAPDCDHTVIIDGTRYIAEECVNESH